MGSIKYSTVAIGLCALLWAEPAEAKHASKLVLGVGVTGLKSTWRGDGGVQGSSKLGFEALAWLTIYLQGRLGASTVDERMMTYVSAGVDLHPFEWGNWRPHLGLALSHQHEETVYVVKESPGGALFGIGDGIRHRAGGEGTLGVSYVLGEQGGVTGFVALESNLIWFPDPRGPEIYVGISSQLGVRYAL